VLTGNKQAIRLPLTTTAFCGRILALLARDLIWKHLKATQKQAKLKVEKHAVWQKNLLPNS
jgi:hypothetical protein